ncbi:30S ribosomal protein S6 [Desulfofustis limnaeus]|jgi:small subunit ribosomal protein S6|uniref:Small ribosomal subunit protein bS6 n=1 Tax=Desulfofustis limnaeus TaxID=2740163 RepID=A0ABN6M5C7_9BACT|nr:30S ribosomal protein S6 [Desulfofustis limnaeus]MDX9894488.1 30S ribosomal protein S6 [Desulfofustis sp.]BDD87120.1 hypothetical protein DPPLL_14850 [Desulfofustis limnaeus]
MRRYEQIYILRPSLSENEINTIIENTNAVILGEQGSVIFLDKWGMRKLAYLIKKESQGFYVFCDLAATPKAVAEIERKFRIDDAVLKYLSVKIADSITAEEISAAQESAASKASFAETAKEDDDRGSDEESSEDRHDDEDQD